MMTVIWRNKTDSNMTEMQFDKKNKYQVMFNYSREGKFCCFVLKDGVLSGD